jgi:hypothetical protein
MHAPAASPAIIEHFLLLLGEQPPRGPLLIATFTRPHVRSHRVTDALSSKS